LPAGEILSSLVMSTLCAGVSHCYSLTVGMDLDVVNEST